MLYAKRSIYNFVIMTNRIELRTLCQELQKDTGALSTFMRRCEYDRVPMTKQRRYSTQGTSEFSKGDSQEHE